LHSQDATLFPAFTSAPAGNSKTTQGRGLYTEEGVAPDRGATLFSSSGKVKEVGLAGGVGPSLDNYVISARAKSARVPEPASVDCTSSVHTPKPKLLGAISRAILRPSGLSARDAAFKAGFKPRGVDSGDWQSRRIRRFYQRFYTGVGVGGQLRVLTLTTSNEALALGKDVHRSFRALVLRLRRRYGRFEYIGVREVKGDRVHLHVVFRGEYMQQASISSMWQAIHASPVVDIRAVYKARGGVRYLAKYLAKEAYNRYWASYNWVFKGWVGWSRRFNQQVGHYPSQGVLGALARLDVGKRLSVMRLLCPGAS